VLSFAALFVDGSNERNAERYADAPNLGRSDPGRHRLIPQSHANAFA